jgi:polygalacturonase
MSRLPALLQLAVAGLACGVTPVAVATEPAAPATQVACSFGREAGRVCDGAADDTAALQQALMQCTAAGEAVLLRAGCNCTAHPLTLPSHVSLQLEEGSRLQAALRSAWPPMHEDGTPSLLHARGARNLSIIGSGTIDGRGQAWWQHSLLPRPHALVLDNCSDVQLAEFTLRDPAQYAVEITAGPAGDRPGSNYRIHGVTKPETIFAPFPFEWRSFAQKRLWTNTRKAQQTSVFAGEGCGP